MQLHFHPGVEHLQLKELGCHIGKPKESGPQKPGDQKLLEQIAELKMIRSLQLRVNARTTTYGRLYNGEQTADPGITRELHNLHDRQERIFD
ncbi:MAG: hypothetical protein QW568_01780, partial [Candidatus Anstonellaceae archaeon]